MGTRDYVFITGIETPDLPAAETPTDPNDTTTKAYADAVPFPTVVGSEGAPQAITAVGGIPFSSVKAKTIMFCEGSGGAVDVSANPQVAAGSVVGQELEIIGCSDANTILLENGNGLSLNGPMSLGLDDSITLSWRGTVWRESARRENT